MDNNLNINTVCEGEDGCGKVFPLKNDPGLCAKCQMIIDPNVPEDLWRKHQVFVKSIMIDLMLINQSQKTYSQCTYCGCAASNIEPVCGIGTKRTAYNSEQL